MYVKHFGLQHSPFKLLLDADLVYRSAALEALWTRITASLGNGKSPQLIQGYAGSGKSLFLHRLALRSIEQGHNCAYIDAADQRADLFESLSQAYGLDYPSRSEEQYLTWFESFLASSRLGGIQNILLLDNLHRMDEQGLQKLVYLIKIRIDSTPLLHVVATLDPAMESPARGVLEQNKIDSTPLVLPPLEKEETGEYIGHRLRACGYQGEPLFPPEVIDWIHGKSRGLPREINYYADLLLTHAYLQGRHKVAREVIRAVDPAYSPTPAASDKSTIQKAAARQRQAREAGSIEAVAGPVTAPGGKEAGTATAETPPQAAASPAAEPASQAAPKEARADQEGSADAHPVEPSGADQTPEAPAEPAPEAQAPEAAPSEGAERRRWWFIAVAALLLITFALAVFFIGDGGQPSSTHAEARPPKVAIPVTRTPPPPPAEPAGQATEQASRPPKNGRSTSPAIDDAKEPAPAGPHTRMAEKAPVETSAAPRAERETTPPRREPPPTTPGGGTKPVVVAKSPPPDERAKAPAAVEKREIARREAPGPEASPPPAPPQARDMADTTPKAVIPVEEQHLAAATPELPHPRGPVAEEQTQDATQAPAPSPEQPAGSAADEPPTSEFARFSPPETGQDQLLSLKALDGVVRRFQWAYENGDEHLLSQLFDAGIRTNESAGRDNILNEYRQFFRVTQARRLEIGPVEWQTSGAVATGVGRFTAHIVTGKGKERTFTGTLTIETVTTPEGPRISALFYRYDS